MDTRIPGIPPKLFKIEFWFNDEECPFPYSPEGLKPTELTKAAVSTSGKTITKTANVIQNLSEVEVPKDLQKLKVSRSLWQNLIYYGDPTRSQPGHNFGRNTLGVALNNESEAHPRCTAFSVSSMYSSSTTYALESEEEIVNSQQSSRDAVFKFVSWFSRWAIMQRYANEGAPEASMAQNPRHWRADVVSGDTRSLETGKAGRPDGILQCNPDVNNAILVAKPYWGYTDNAVREVYNGEVLSIDGAFDWASNIVAAQLLRQIWGSLVAMKCNFAIWTNGKKVFLAVKTGINEMVLSTPHPWSHNDTTKAIFGLTYAAIDDASGKWLQVEGGPVDLINELVGQTEELPINDV